MENQTTQCPVVDDLLLTGGETKAEMVEKINKAITFLRDAAQNPSQAQHSVNQKHGERLDQMESGYTTLQEAFEKASRAQEQASAKRK